MSRTNLPAHRPRLDAEAIDAMIGRPEGATVAECCDAAHVDNVRRMLKRLQNLVNSGQAHTAKEPGRISFRWFSSAAARDAWAAANPQHLSREQRRAAQAAGRGPTMMDKLMAVITERGGHGTLSSDLCRAVQREIGNIGSWVTSLENTGRVDCIMHRRVRIITPAGVPLLPAALQACQRRIDREMAKRGGRNKYAITPAKPGQPAGVTLAPRKAWRDTVPANDGAIAPSIIQAPRFDHRYQVDPATHVAGGFADMGPGRYDMGPSHAVAQWLGRRAA